MFIGLQIKKCSDRIDSLAKVLVEKVKNKEFEVLSFKEINGYIARCNLCNSQLQLIGHEVQLIDGIESVGEQSFDDFLAAIGFTEGFIDSLSEILDEVALCESLEGVA